MRKTGKQGLLARIKAFDTVNLDKKAVDKAAKLIEPFDENSVATCSVAIGAFYVWVGTSSVRIY